MVERSGGLCESCYRYVGDEGHLDHFFGRSKVKEAPSNCWYLCATKCDPDKTASRPTRVAWLLRFVVHCGIHGFTAEAQLAMDKVYILRAKGLG